MEEHRDASPRIADGAGIRAERKPHPGVQIREPRERQPHYVARYRDPDTGRMRDSLILGADAKNKHTRAAFAVKLSKKIRQRKDEIKAGARPHIEAAMSIEDALKRYFEAHDLNAKALEVYRAAADDLQGWCDDHGVRNVRDLNKARLFEFRTWLKAMPKRVPKSGGKRGEYVTSHGARSPHSANKALRALSAILNVLRAADVVRLHSDEIKDALKRFKAETERRSFLTARAIRELLSETREDPMNALVRCMILTGLRLEEAILIEWRDVEPDVLRIRAAVGKGGKMRDIDLEVAPSAFPTKRGEDNERVFPFTEGEVRGLYERTKVKWTPHKLRRTYCTFFTCTFGPWPASKSAGHGVAVLEKNYAGLVKVPEGCKTLEQAMGLD
jgi:integrase